MPYHVQSDGPLLRIRFSGAITSAELFQHAREMARMESNLPTTPDRLTDLSETTEIHIDFDGMERFRQMRHQSGLKNPIRSAVVAPRDMQFGLARMFQTLSSNPLIEVQVFRDHVSAEAWLSRRG